MAQRATKLPIGTAVGSIGERDGTTAGCAERGGSRRNNAATSATTENTSAATNSHTYWPVLSTRTARNGPSAVARVVLAP